MVLTTTDNVVTETMSGGVPHKAVALLNKSLTSECVAAVCTEAE